MGRIVTKGACCWWEASECERRSVRLVANRRQRRAAALEVQTISVVNSTEAATQAGQGDSQRLPEQGGAPTLCFSISAYVVVEEKRDRLPAAILGAKSEQSIHANHR